MHMATIDDFKKIELRVGKILSAEAVPASEKLVKLSVSFGEAGTRQVIAGIAPYISDLAALVGKKFAFAANLEPRLLMGLESQAMVLAAGDKAAFSLLAVDSAVEEGSLVR